MAKRFIHYEIKNGIEYASIYTPQRIDGKKVNNPEYLGRVVDKANGIYKNRTRGLFAYNLEKGFTNIPTDINYDSTHTAIQEEKLILDFGDAYCLYSIMQSNDLFGIIQSLMPGQEDTLMSLVGYKLLASGANRYAEDWWSGSYTRILFPNAKLRSQRISEFYKELGDETIQRDFFKKYLYMICKGKSVGILIDSTGLPNDINFPLTAVHTHSGITSNETRLILVIDRKNGMPLFFRYNAGNIVDVTTLRATISELDAYNINIDFVIVDAGYCSENNIVSLYGDGDINKKIPFLTRLASNWKLYKQLISENINDLEHSKHMLWLRDRLLSVKRVEVDLFGNNGYAYVSLDHQRRHDEIQKYLKTALHDKNISDVEKDEAIKTKGVFILISSEKIEINEIMPLYYTRQSVEQVFDLSKNNVDLLPLRVHDEEAFRGHLMLSFIASIVYLIFNQKLNDTLYNAEGAFMILRNQKCKVFVDRILPKEVNKKMNDIYKKLNISPPTFIPYVW